MALSSISPSSSCVLPPPGSGAVTTSPLRARYRKLPSGSANHAPVPRSTPAIGPGGQADLAPVEIPIEGEGIITFTIAADTDAEALESDEFNNAAIGTCTIIN